MMTLFCCSVKNRVAWRYPKTKLLWLYTSEGVAFKGKIWLRNQRPWHLYRVNMENTVATTSTYIQYVSINIGHTNVLFSKVNICIFLVSWLVQCFGGLANNSILWLLPYLYIIYIRDVRLQVLWYTIHTWGRIR